MNSSMHPELTACVDNSASLQTRPSSLIYRGLTVQTNRATSKDTEVFGRIGYTSAKLTASSGNLSYTGSSVNSLSYGAGLQTEITKDWYAQADYMVFSKKDGGTAKGFGISAGYRF
jgi:opacity protein-like surface antigen